MSTAKVIILSIIIALGAAGAGWLLHAAAGGKFSGMRHSGDIAEIRFNVLGRDQINPLTRDQIKPDEGELTSCINNSMKLMRSREFFDQVLILRDVVDTQWYKGYGNRSAAYAALDTALEIERIPNTSLIRVTLQIEPRADADVILNKFGEMYISWTDTIAAKMREQDIKAYREALNNAEKNLNRAQTDLDDFRSLHDINISVHEVAVASLKEMQTELRKLTIERTVLQTNLDALSATPESLDTNKQKIEAINSAQRDNDTRILALKKMHDEKQADLRRLDNDLVAYRSREESVAAYRVQFNRAQEEFTRQDNIIRSEQSRFQLVERARPI